MGGHGYGGVGQAGLSKAILGLVSHVRRASIGF